jgi:hypothetical protein
MALIQRFEDRDIGSGRVHGEVSCGYHWFDAGNRRILQLETYGSDARAMPGKVSQSIQLDENSAKTLMAILRRAFPSI